MAQGLQIFDESGKCIFDAENATTTYTLGTGKTSGAKASGAITDDRLTGRNWWVLPIDIPRSSTCVPNFSVNGNKLQWAYSSPLSTNDTPMTYESITFMYGVY